MDYLRKITSFGIDPQEEWALASNLRGDVLMIDLERFEIVHETRAHAGQIEGIEAHPTLPYVATVSGDRTVSICKFDASGIRLLHQIRERDIKAENDYEWIAENPPLSQAIGFHSTKPKLLTRNADGATVELEFDDQSYRVLWARGYFHAPGGAKDVIFVTYMAGSDHVVSTGRGGVVVVDPERREEPIFRWQYDEQNHHCATFFEGTEYFIASDSRRIFKVDFSGKKPPVLSPFITRDHLERIDYNPVSRRAFCSSFDRCVYEFDPHTLESKGVVVETPFKLRFFQTLRRHPDTMIIQCRNGSLIKVDLGTKKVIKALRETPNALWSGVKLGDGEMVFAGEGPEVLSVRATGEDPKTRRTAFASRWTSYAGDPGRFTKRMIVHPPTGNLILARSDGDVIVANPRNGQSRRLLNLGSAVRDVAAAPEGSTLFAITESGKAHRIDFETGRVLATFSTPPAPHGGHPSAHEEPLWSLAHNPKRGLLAVASRVGSAWLLHAEDLSIHREIKGGDVYPPKRMRWLDDDRLLVGRASVVHLIHADDPEPAFDLLGGKTVVIKPQGNTVEDFDWSADRRYFALCTYVRKLSVFDLETWRKHDDIWIDLDFPHGMMWLDPARSEGAHPHELVAWGRAGVVRHFRFHDSRLIPLGELSREHSARIPPEVGTRVL
jgi:WD40 repeat protein